MRSRILDFGLLLTVLCGSLLAADRPPNFVMIYCDDLGYADIGPFGAKGYKTPNLDRMAAEGMKFTDFHSAAAVCSEDRKSTRLNSSHEWISYAVFCLKKKIASSTTTRDDVSSSSCAARN